MSRISRRRFCQSLGATSLLSQVSLTASDGSLTAGLPQSTTAAPGSPHIGNLYPFVQKQCSMPAN